MELYIDMRTLAELVGVGFETARRWRYDEDKHYRRPPNTFPAPWGGAIEPGHKGTPAPIFALSEVLDWLADNRPYDLRIALELGNVGRELGRLQERATERQSERASSASM